MADIDLPGSITHGTGGIGKQSLLLIWAHQPEKQAGLGIVIVILTMVPMIGSTFETERWF